jgi:putative two-component system response regulator
MPSTLSTIDSPSSLGVGGWPARFSEVRDLCKSLMSSGSVEAPAQLDQFVSELSNCPLGIGFWHFSHTREPTHGLSALDDAVVLAQHLGNLPLLRRSLMVKGILCADTGDIGMAIECYSESLDLAEQLGDRPAMAAVWNNLGVALMYAAQFRDATLCFQRVSSVAEGIEFPYKSFLLQSALTNIANCFLHLEEFDAGIEAAQRAVDVLLDPLPHEVHTRVVLEYAYTRLLLARGNIPRARERSMLAKGFAARTTQPRAQVAAENAEGLVEAFTGHFDIGVSRLAYSLERAKTLKSAYRDTLIALVMAHERANRPNEAIEYQRELMRHTSAAIEVNALFHNKLHLDRLKENTDPTGPISLVQSLHMEVLKRKTVEKTMLQERLEMLERLAVTAELRDDSTGEHSYRVGRLASLLGRELGLDLATCQMLDLAGRLHDIGKIGVPDHILLKPGKLTEDERLLMETHTFVGAELLSKSEMPELKMAEVIARHHHQKWDGTGYPRAEALAGEDIPLAARITALADVYDALTHVRPYKLAWPTDVAMAEIARLRGTHFDPHLCDVFLVLMRRLLAEYENLDGYLAQASQDSPYLRSREKISSALNRKASYADPDAPITA